MLEYGNGVGQVAGQANGGSASSGQSVDVGVSIGQFISNSTHTLSTVPPAYLLIGFVVIVVGLIMLRRAF